MSQKSLCCYADIKLTGKERPDAYECTKCGRIIGTELPTGTPIPSEELKNIAEKYGKDIVVMVAWDLESGHLHGVSYAKTEAHKAGAHNMSKAFISLAGGDIHNTVEFETLSDDHTKS